MTYDYKEVDIEALRREYERVDKLLIDVIADMAVLKYRIDQLTKDDID